MTWEQRLTLLAREQAGAVGIDQLAGIGCDWNHWARAKRNGRWSIASRRVLASNSAPLTDALRVWCALLDVGGRARLHGPSALGWVGVRGYDLSTIHVERARSQRDGLSDLAVIHQLRDVRDCDECIVRGVPSVSVLRAIWSEASRFANEALHDIGLRKIGRLLDDAHRDGLVTWPDLQRSVLDLEVRGRAGTQLMRELAEGRPVGSSPTESRNEDRFEAILADADLPPFERQAVVGESRPIGRCDFRDPVNPLVVEVNSLTFHSTVSDQREDEARYAALNHTGLAVAVVWETDLWSHPSNVVQTLRRARRLAHHQNPGIVHSAGCPWPYDRDRLVVSGTSPALRG